MIKNNFIRCIKESLKAEITYFSKKDQANTTRIVAPLDIGPRKDGKGGYKDEGKEKFWFYDFTGTHNSHLTPKDVEDIVSMEMLESHYSLNDIPMDFSTTERFISR